MGTLKSEFQVEVKNYQMDTKTVPNQPRVLWRGSQLSDLDLKSREDAGY